jgi:hypothetical protein
MKKWLKENIFIKDMFIYIMIAIMIFYIPSWGSFIIAIITRNEYYYAVSIGWIILWAGPFTPTIPIILGIAISIQQITKRIRGKKENT